LHQSTGHYGATTVAWHMFSSILRTALTTVLRNSHAYDLWTVSIEHIIEPVLFSFYDVMLVPSTDPKATIHLTAQCCSTAPCPKHCKLMTAAGLHVSRSQCILRPAPPLRGRRRSKDAPSTRPTPFPERSNALSEHHHRLRRREFADVRSTLHVYRVRG